MKKLVVLGDSIARGTFTGEGDWCPLSLANPTFAQVVGESLGFDDICNYGTNGISISETTAQEKGYCLCKWIDQAVQGEVFLLAGGTNDYGNDGGVELGTSADTEDVSFWGALYVLFRKIAERYASQAVYVLTPLLRVGENVPNEKGYILSQYRDAIQSRAKEFGFTVIDGTKIPLDTAKEDDKRRYMLDGLHPNTEGHAIIATALIEVMRKP